MTGKTTPLQLGIAALKAQNNEEARKQFILAISNDPENPEPWLWLGIVASRLDERIQYIEQALSLQPDNTRARILLEKFKQQQIDTWLKQGISDVQAGYMQQGIEILTKVVNADESQIEAWWWLGQASDSPHDKALCYENVLTLDPEHSGAQLAMQSIQQIESEETMDLLQQDNSFTDDNPHHSLDAKTKFKENERPRPSDDADAPETTIDRLANTLSCPFCAASTEIKHKKCPQCHRSLLKQQYHISGASTQFSILLGLEISIIIFSQLLSFILLGFVDTFINAEDKYQLLRVYLLSNEPLLDVNMKVAYSIISPFAFQTALLPSIMALIIICGVLFRKPSLYFGAIGISSIRILVCILTSILVVNGITSSSSLVQELTAGTVFIKQMRYSVYGALGVNFLLAANALISLINNHERFSNVKARQLLEIDDDISGNSQGLRQRSRLYAEDKAWALTALHARESLLLKKEIEGYTLLAMAYFHLGWHEKVSIVLKEALDYAPQNTQILELEQVLNQQISLSSD